MIGIVIVAHGNLGREFISVLEHVTGQQEHLADVSVGASDDLEAKRAEIVKKIDAVDQGKGVMILTDMFGGTPSNLAISVTASRKAEVIAGINLPLLIKLAQVRKTEKLEQAAESAMAAGRKYISAADALLKASS